MIRYCLTLSHKISPCLAGWGTIDDNGYHNCADEPQERNCRNLIFAEPVDWAARAFPGHPASLYRVHRHLPDVPAYRD